MTTIVSHFSPRYRPGMPLAGFCAAELFVAASVRLWAIEEARSRYEGQDWPDWRRGMSLAGLAEETSAAFDTMMRIIGVCALDPLPVRPPPCPRLGAGEALVLASLQHAQAGEGGDLRFVLASTLCPTGVRLVLGPVEAVADGLGARGLKLGPRHVPGGGSVICARPLMGGMLH